MGNSKMRPSGQCPAQPNRINPPRPNFTRDICLQTRPVALALNLTRSVAHTRQRLEGSFDVAVRCPPVFLYVGDDCARVVFAFIVRPPANAIHGRLTAMRINRARIIRIAFNHVSSNSTSRNHSCNEKAIKLFVDGLQILRGFSLPSLQVRCDTMPLSGPTVMTLRREIITTCEMSRKARLLKLAELKVELILVVIAWTLLFPGIHYTGW